MTLGEAVRRDIIAMINDDPITFTFEETDYTGAISGQNRSRPLDVGGFEPQPDLTIAINLKNAQGDNTFGSVATPAAGDRITFDEVEYRVDRTETDSFGECLQIELRSKEK